MAVVNTLSNKFKFSLMNKEVDCDTDSFKLALMTPSFTFNPDTHEQWSLVSGEEIASGNGYTTGGQVLVSGELTQDNVNNQGVMTWLNNQFVASSGAISSTGSGIIYDDTHANKIVMGCTDYGVDYDITDGMTLKFTSIALKL